MVGEGALELGMAPSKRIEKRLKKTEEIAVALHERKYVSCSLK